VIVSVYPFLRAPAKSHNREGIEIHREEKVMKVSTNRSEFDAALNDPRNVFLLIFGGSSTTAASLYDAALSAVQSESWRKSVLVENIDLLTDSEKASWSVADNNYTTLSKTHVIVDHGNIKDLCLNNGKPSTRKLQTAFARADQQ